MDIAIAEAYAGIGAGDGGPFGSVIVKDNEIIATGHNHVVANNDPTCHGEIDAIRKACKKLGTFDLTGCQLYTSSYPCPMCMYAMRWANIRQCFYGCTIDDAEDIGFRDRIFYDEIEIDLNGYVGDLHLVELDRDKCLKLFDDYAKTNHINY